MGDWNHDGKDDIGVLQATGGKYTLRVPEGSTNRYVSIGWGYSSDIPFTGDWNHDGRSELGLWRPSTAQVVLRTAAEITGPYVNQVTDLGRTPAGVDPDRMGTVGSIFLGPRARVESSWVAVGARPCRRAAVLPAPTPWLLHQSGRGGRRAAPEAGLWDR